MLTPRQAANRLGVSPSLVYQLCDERVLKHYRIGGKGKRGRIRIEEAEVERYRESCLRDASQLVAVPPLKHLSLDRENT
jgi:excisionase family DNA binding protein